MTQTGLEFIFISKQRRALETSHRMITKFVIPKKRCCLAQLLLYHKFLEVESPDQRIAT
jgi:hypothetical protein